AGILLPRPLDDRLHLGFLHGLADLPVDDESAVAVEDAAQEVEGPADVEVGDIDVPVLMRPQGLLEALPLAGWSPPSRSQFAGRFEHAVDTGGADGHDIGVEHHVRQPRSRSHPESGCILNRLPRNPRYFSVNSWMIVNISYDRYLSSRTVVDFGSCEVFSMVFV